MFEDYREICYVVVGIRTHALCYAGISLAQAAFDFNPGTCFGKGFDLTEAKANAHAMADRLLAAAKQRRDPLYT